MYTLAIFTLEPGPSAGLTLLCSLWVGRFWVSLDHTPWSGYCAGWQVWEVTTALTTAGEVLSLYFEDVFSIDHLARGNHFRVLKLFREWQIGGVRCWSTCWPQAQGCLTSQLLSVDEIDCWLIAAGTCLSRISVACTPPSIRVYPSSSPELPSPSHGGVVAI